MQRILFSLFAVLFPLVGFARGEKVYTFRSDVLIDTSGYISVREDIRIYAKGEVFKRGITRALPLNRSDRDGKMIPVNYDIESVKKDGKPENFFTGREGGDLVIYVGNKDVFLDSGWYSYTINYKTAGQIGFFEDYDELSWNVNALSDYPLDTVSAVIRLPEGAEVLSYRCYTGKYGTTESNCRADTLSDGSLYLEAVNLAPQEMLTVSIGFTKGVVRQPATQESGFSKPVPTTFFAKYGLPVVSAILFLLLLAYYFFTWRKYGIDPPKPVVIPQFSSPEGLSPASVGMLYKEKYWDDLITSSIVNLAVKGFLRIKETEKSSFLRRKDRIYTLIKTKDDDNTLPKEEGIVLRDLFKDKGEVVLDGKYNSDIANLMNSYRYDLNKQYNPVLKEGANRKFMVLPWMMLVVYFGFLLYFVRFEPVSQIGTFIVVALVSFPVAMVLSMVLRKILKKSKIRWFGYVVGTALVVGSLSLLIFFSLKQLSVNAVGFIIGFPLIIISFLAYGFLIKRPGERKLYLQSQIEGLKMYMDTAEEKQLQFFNPPAVTPEIFEQLLPYAIALGMEDIWGEKFQYTILTAMQQPQPYQPPWFTGTVMRPARFGHMLNSTLSNTVNHAATLPQSSGSGGGNWGSGSFGGGFSGMGGGGGRVGGW